MRAASHENMPCPTKNEEAFEPLDWGDLEILEIVEIASAKTPAHVSSLDLDFDEDTPVRRPTAYLLGLLRPDETLPP